MQQTGPLAAPTNDANAIPHPGTVIVSGTGAGELRPPPADAANRDEHGRLRGFKVGGEYKQFCYNWRRSGGECAEPCPEGRLHRCEICTSTRHKTTEHYPRVVKGKGGKDKDGKGNGKGKDKGDKGKKGKQQADSAVTSE